MMRPSLRSTIAVLLAGILLLSPVTATRQKKTNFAQYRHVPKFARNSEAAVLVALYNATNGPSWLRQWGWLDSSIPHCDWEGVGCRQNSTGSVISLELPSNALHGNMTSLGGLKNLTVLNLSRNKLEGSLDQVGIQGMKLLQNVNLAYNSFAGTIPTSLASAKTIRRIDVSNNNLVGTIGASMNNYTMLQHFDISGNILKGSFPFIGNLTYLQYLDLSDNGGISGTLNASGFHNLTNLTTLNLADNNFTGGLSSIANLTLLQELDLSSNALTGGMTSLANLTMLKSLNLAYNDLNGTLVNTTLLTNLTFLDLSFNGHLTGNITGLAVLTSLTDIYLAGNQFNGTLDALANLTSLTTLDIHLNNFTGDLSSISFLPFLESIDASQNQLNGTLPPLQPSLYYFNISHNTLVGSIPNLAGLTLLRWLDLSHQVISRVDATGNRLTQGLTGSIPPSIGECISLEEVRFQDNLLSGEIPQDISRLGFLSFISLESNRLGGTIPASLNLLEQLQVVSLANNELYGPIPELGGSEDVIRTVQLKGNAELDAPAPFLLCDLDDLDIREDGAYCPKDRQALVAFYMATKGADWNNDTNWLDPEQHHCTWFGVTCDETSKQVLHLSLSRNGLAGAIPSDLFNLTSLQSIDFNDNELFGALPSELGKLTELTKLRLSYNELTGIPTTFGYLSKLAFLHLHGNRISGDDSYITIVHSEASDDEEMHPFISDCGDPVDSDEPFQCDGCDMCCNSLEECQIPVQSTFDSFNGWVTALILSAFVLAVLLLVGGLIYNLVKRGKLRPSKTNAREACGDDSVYSFVITHSYAAWSIAFVTIFIQIAIFALFLNASVFGHELSDWIYSWRCPRNSETCDDDSNTGSYGWIVWGLLVFTSVLQDTVNGIKLLNLAASRASIHSFCGSAILLSMTLLAVWTSATYNRAIATSSTELIVNAVILLFINDIDEQIYNAVQVINPKWVERMNSQADELSTKLLEKDISGGGGEKENIGDGDKSASATDTFYPAETWESKKDINGGDSTNDDRDNGNE